MKNVVVLGDKTSHSSTVISASSTFEIEGKIAALLHDMVSCEEHGPNRIIECEPGYEEQGKGKREKGKGKRDCGTSLQN